jgi:hypothetical protein
MHEKNQELDRFEILLDYELVCSTRYRRFMSLIMCGKNGHDRNITINGFKSAFRNCDRIFELNNEVVVIMPETDPMGAIRAVARLRELQVINGTKLSLASFPNDGQTADMLMRKARFRLETELIDNQ